jgi:prephenate dehydratase
MRIAYLGPAGTFTEDALLAALGDEPADLVPAATVYDAITAVDSGEAERALVPFENSIEGAVRSTLDTLAFDDPSVTIVGEYDHPIRHSLIARRNLALDEIAAVLSHPQASAQCSRFIREQLPGAEVRAAPSTAEAVRQVATSDDPWAALAARSAARIYECDVLADGVEDSPDNVTRFVWVAPPDTRPTGGGRWRTTLVFAELGEDKPGALVEALVEFTSRGVNLTRIESRPTGERLGRYCFYFDAEGHIADARVGDALAALRRICADVRYLGSYPRGTPGEPPRLPPGRDDAAFADATAWLARLRRGD